jgi:hypothetical protein
MSSPAPTEGADGDRAMANGPDRVPEVTAA